MTDIERIVDYIAKYDKQFPGRIQGAASEKIAALEAAAGQPLRTVYRDFLRTMGESMDWLQPIRATFNIDEVLAWYRAESWRPPVGVFKFGLALDDPFFDVYLEQGDVPQPRVVTMPGGPAPDFEALKKSFRNPAAGSLPEFLGTSAYRKLRMDVLPSSLRIAGNDTKQPLLVEVQPILQPLGFAPLWFSNDWVQVLDAQDAAVIATQYPKTVLAIDIAAANSARLNNLVNRLRPRLGLVHMFTRLASRS